MPTTAFFCFCLYYISPTVATLTLLTLQPFIFSTAVAEEFEHWAEVLSSCPPNLSQPPAQLLPGPQMGQFLVVTMSSGRNVRFARAETLMGESLPQTTRGQVQEVRHKYG